MAALYDEIGEGMKRRGQAGNSRLRAARFEPTTKRIQAQLRLGYHSLPFSPLGVMKAGLAYHSPDKFRHGHAVYALKMAKDVSALKAVSQNLMHKNLSITDGIYGTLSDVDVRNRISNLGANSLVGSKGNSDEIKMLLMELLRKLG